MVGFGGFEFADAHVVAVGPVAVELVGTRSGDYFDSKRVVEVVDSGAAAVVVDSMIVNYFEISNSLLNWHSEQGSDSKGQHLFYFDDVRYHKPKESYSERHSDGAFDFAKSSAADYFCRNFAARHTCGADAS